MKKERIILFPEKNRAFKEEVDTEIPNITAGDVFKIKGPSNRYYRFVYHSLQFGQHQLTELQKLSEVTNTIVRVSSVLRMKDGSNLAVLRNYDESPFFDTIDRLFADTEHSVLSKEVVPLNLEEQALLKSS